MSLAPEILRERLQYNPETGVFVWKPSKGQTREDKIFNTRFSGKVAGNVGPSGYRQIRLLGKLYFAHRLAWFYAHGKWPEEELDHINRCRSDDRISNLREATRAQNQVNVSIRKDSASGIKGVCFFPSTGKWRAKIKKNGKTTHIGVFDTAAEAAAAFQMASFQLHGAFSTTGAIQ